MVRKMLVYSIRVFLLPYCKVEKKWHYIAWTSWSLHTLSAVLIAEAIREPVRRKDIEYWL
jgi:hypothetical protein